jgi:hypothetical protein
LIGFSSETEPKAKSNTATNQSTATCSQMRSWGPNLWIMSRKAWPEGRKKKAEDLSMWAMKEKAWSERN